MLDDLKYIHQKDSSDALGIAARQCTQLQHDFGLGSKAAFKNIQNVVFAGMGGSALAALMLRTWPTVPVPFEIVRDYDIPPYTSKNTLFIASSYSGNTEETLSALAEAETAGAQIAVIASGGKLKEIAQSKQYLFAELPAAEQPRYAVFYSLRASLEVLVSAGVLAAPTLLSQLEAAVPFLQQAVTAWGAEVPTASNPAKRLAQELMGKSVVIYAGPKLFPAAYKWKISCNENAKHIAWTNQIPEFNHNEFIGWSQQPTDKPYVVIDLRSNLEHERVQKRFEVSARMLSGMRPEPHVVAAAGHSVLEQMLWTITYGDFVTLYLALLSGLNPAPVDLVEKFKKAMNE